jgi:hypothetical protein
MTVGIKGPNGKVMASMNLDPTGKDTVKSRFAETPGRPKNPNGVFDGVFDLSFTPKDIGRHSAMIFMDKKPVQGSPLTIDVSENPTLVFAEGKTTETFVSPRQEELAAARAAPITVTPIIQATTTVQPAQSAPQRAQPIMAAAVAVQPVPIQAQPIQVQPVQAQPIQVQPVKATPQPEPVAAAPVSPKKHTHSEKKRDEKPKEEKKAAPKEEKKREEKPKEEKKAAVIVTEKPKEEKKAEASKVEISTKSRTITRVTVGKSFTIRLQVGGSGGAAADAPIKEKGKVIGQAKAKAGANDTYEISWVPPHAGNFSTVLVIGGVEVGGSEFEFEAFNVPITCRPIANSENIGPGIPCTITFAIDNATPSKLSAVIKGSDGKLGTSISTRRRADGTWDVNFTPPDSPSFTVELTADTTPVENKLTIQLV